jgi:hypothetical protein
MSTKSWLAGFGCDAGILTGYAGLLLGIDICCQGVGFVFS